MYDILGKLFFPKVFVCFCFLFYICLEHYNISVLHVLDRFICILTFKLDIVIFGFTFKLNVFYIEFTIILYILTYSFSMYLIVKL